MRHELLLVCALLGGCVSHGPFPSLAPRPGEQLAIEEPARTAPAAADDPALRARIAALLDEARAGARAFDADFDAAAATIARSGPEGSESWADAQQALSRLEAARIQTTRAAAELDQIGLARADMATSAADRAALEAAIAEADRIAANQQARIGRLSGR